VSALQDTSRRLRALGVVRATLLVDAARARANIRRFQDRARASGVALRPHFKTHQSAAVGQWFREAGIDRATVSSLGQARYFADHGWRDLTLAIGANPLEIPAYDALAARVDLGLITDSEATVAALAAGLGRAVGLWLEVDTGDGRTGVPWRDTAALARLAAAVEAAPRLALRGLLTHAGHSYASADPAAVCRDSLEALAAARRALGRPGLLLSAGDTPGFAALPHWRGADEARPGNFVFFDLMQLDHGVCREEDLACAVAAPVISVHPERHEAVIHAGAVHLAKEGLDGAGGAEHCYGRLQALGAAGLGGLLPGWSLVRLSQEHGVLGASSAPARASLAGLRPGALVLVAPVHSCLSCEQFGSYLTTDGEVLPRYRRD
jgi:D-serine deaminase-like pyridoxal phosphate-dependent protein